MNWINGSEERDMNLSKGDIEALARYRAGKGKFMFGMLTFGILWIVVTLISMYQITVNKDALIWGIVGIVVFFMWFIVYLYIIEFRAKKLVCKLREENEKDIKS
jgi:uncharacterized BrkB/YihY/UPF0761 family membrane protein